MIYYNARYYVPYLNRFISADTIVPDPANPQSYNRYSYVLNNPLNYVDPDGHDAVATSLSKDEAQLLLDAMDFLLMQNNSEVTILEYLRDQFTPNVLAGLTTKIIVDKLVAAGFITATGVSSTVVGIGVSVIVGAAYAWNSTATQNGLNTLRDVRGSLDNAMKAAGEGDKIDIYATNTWLAKDTVQIMVNGVDENGNTSYGGKYYSKIETGIVNHVGKMMVSLVMDLTTHESGTNTSVTYWRGGNRYEYSGMQWSVINEPFGYANTNICYVYSNVCTEYGIGGQRR